MEPRRRAFFPPGFLKARMETKTPPQDPKDESSPRQDPPPGPPTTDFEQSTTTGKAHSKRSPAGSGPSWSAKRPNAAQSAQAQHSLVRGASAGAYKARNTV